MIDKELRSEREKKTGRAAANGLVSIGSCPLHVIHNTFKHGFTRNERQVEDILYEFWFFFSRSSAPREDYLSVAESIGDSVDRFIKRFVITRWIKVGPVIERVIDQWSIIKEYFLVYLPKIDKNIINNDRWQRIKNYLDQQQTFVRFQFVLYVYRHIFSKTLTWLQQDEPLVHMLFEECSNLFRNVLISFIKDDLIMNKTVKQLFSITLDSQANQKPDSKLETDETTRNELKEMSTNDKATFFKDARLIYLTIAQELKRTLPLNNEFLQHVRFIHPLLRQHESTRNSMMIVARELPHLLSDDDLDQLNAEWRLYVNETVPIEWYKHNSVGVNSQEIIKYHPVDYYWKYIFAMKNSSGGTKFLILSKLVKSILSLSHGNADVERGFSENASLVSDDRWSLTNTSINGIRATKDAVKFYGSGKVHQVSLLDSVKEAKSRYHADQEKMQRFLKEKEEAEAAAK
ncbi:unnamed protein product [Rotaria sp. Silwood2]|nr:unnamed protein product [Rotaria sp. Silwood2]